MTTPDQGLTQEQGMVVDHKTGQIMEQGDEPQTTALTLTTTREMMQSAMENIALMEYAFAELLEVDIDYGQFPGIPQPFLLDAGAAKCRDFWNVYPDHSILSQTKDDNGLLTIIGQTKLISRATGQVVATGVGSCSQKETKYRDRWVEKPEDFGVEREKLRTKQSQHTPPRTLYKILNPDVDDLVHTIVVMSAKRSEVDATKNLPGVATAIAKLRKGMLGDGDGPTMPAGARPQPRPSDEARAPRPAQAAQPSAKDVWTPFWTTAKQMGYEHGDVHRICNVASMKDWVDSGKTPEQALDLLREQRVRESVAERGSEFYENQPEASGAAAPAAGTGGASILSPDTEGETFIQAWDEARRLVKTLGITEDKLQMWWNKHGVGIIMGDFSRDNPPNLMKADMVLEFRDELLAIQKKAQ